MAGDGGHGTVHIPWYATLFRADKFAVALADIARIALRYNATDYHVYRSRTDRYSFLQTATFDDALDFERYWAGEEFIDFRAKYSSWYQIPVVPGWTDLLASGELALEAAAAAPDDRVADPQEAEPAAS